MRPNINLLDQPTIEHILTEAKQILAEIGMLDYVMLFSLAKLVLDDELCGQALHFVRDMEAGEGGTAVSLARELLNDQQLMTAEHTINNWREHLYLPTPVIDRQNRDKWTKAGSPSLIQRAAAEVEKSLAAYQPIKTDPHIERELRHLLQSGLENKETLPPIPAS